MPELHDSPPPSPSEVKTFIADPSGYAGTAPAEQDGEATLLPGSMLAGRYRVIRKLGAGGMGEVYLAEHVDIEREVAIKTLTARGKKKGGVERFMQEARTASRIRHPNIVDITDFRARGSSIAEFDEEPRVGVDRSKRGRRSIHLRSKSRSSPPRVRGVPLEERRAARALGPGVAPSGANLDAGGASRHE